ncbi:oxidoreductase [Aspergillus piperis CBS 112811]|uniref:Oxidoreductase n=1 Tax=Aspergillus piperis CBS 112811 TaxID=1448313 RepID=A0A8G1QXZ2_9EURO|nr:oxidoreductase [Aspergillus piperis CBS 112811]RAH55963.1 oxidoreductase [Aspergillus piperis CBS 112811]
MPTQEYFDQIPPFPSELPVVSLSKISLEGLKNNTTEEVEELFEACQQWGFFLLDLRGSDEGAALLQDAEGMFELTTQLSTLGQETLKSYTYKPPDFMRYKGIGSIKTDNGEADHIHAYSLSQDEVLGYPNRSSLHPEVINTSKEQLRKFIEHAHAILDEVLAKLDICLGIEPKTLEALSPLDQESESLVRLLWSPAQANPDYDRISFGGHTDMGTMTLLFNIAGGLQVLPASRENVKENWQYIKPEPGCAVVNVGDTLVEWTGGVLRSSLHRVVTAPGDQAMVQRESVAYLVRPKRTASLQRLKGGVIPPLLPGEEDETRSVDEWNEWRSRQIALGQLKPETRGGRNM